MDSSSTLISLENPPPTSVRKQPGGSCGTRSALKWWYPPSAGGQTTNQDFRVDTADGPRFLLRISDPRGAGPSWRCRRPRFAASSTWIRASRSCAPCRPWRGDASVEVPSEQDGEAYPGAGFASCARQVTAETALTTRRLCGSCRQITSHLGGRLHDISTPLPTSVQSDVGHLPELRPLPPQHRTHTTGLRWNGG